MRRINNAAFYPQGRGHRSRGAIIVIVLLALVLLASLVFYIFNVGRHVAERVESQNAADNAALSGGRWMARSFNTVAMNNVEMTRLITLAAVLDAVPLSIEHTLEDQQAILDALDRQDGTGYGSDEWVADTIANIVRPNIQQQVDYLLPLNDLFNESGYDVARMTFFKDSDGTRGDLWRAFEALGAKNRAVMESLGVLAQQSAFRGAQISQQEAGLSSGGLLLPWVPQVPWELNNFDDFGPAVSDGRLPDGQDDAEISRGPFDVLFGQREIGRADTDFTELGTDGRHGGNALGWNPPPSTQEFESATVETYFTTGTYDRMLTQIRRLGETPPIDADGRRRSQDRSFYQAPAPPAIIDDSAPLSPSLWADRASFAANAKINRVFPGTAASGQAVFDPLWVINADRAVAIAEAENGPAIVYGLYLTLEFRRTKTSATFPVTFSEPELINWGLHRSEQTPIIQAGDSVAALLSPVSDQVWREELPSTGDTGFGEGDEQYLIYQIWLGINIGEEVTIRNPFNIDTEERTELPGPINFTVDAFAPDQPATRDALRLLGVAHQPREASIWSERFDDERPDTTMVALAQAEVFNNHSWDLWTAMWHSQLTPVSGLEDWIETLEDPQGTEDMPWLEEADVQSVTAYLRASLPLMELMAGGE
ncbi:MAG: pilus assembly protein TadG-related protein [Planctomycetota bacterium]